MEVVVLRNFGTIAHGLDTPNDTMSVDLLRKIEVKRQEVAKIAISISRYHAIIEEGVGAVTAKRLAALEHAHASGLAAISEMENDLGRMQRAKPRTEEMLALKTLIGGLDRLPPTELYAARAKINGGLSKLLSSVVVTKEIVTLRLVDSFSQQWRVAGTGSDRQPISGVIKEFQFPVADPSRAVALVMQEAIEVEGQSSGS